MKYRKLVLACAPVLVLAASMLTGVVRAQVPEITITEQYDGGMGGGAGDWHWGVELQPGWGVYMPGQTPRESEALARRNAAIAQQREQMFRYLQAQRAAGVGDPTLTGLEDWVRTGSVAPAVRASAGTANFRLPGGCGEGLRAACINSALLEARINGDISPQYYHRALKAQGIGALTAATFWVGIAGGGGLAVPAGLGPAASHLYRAGVTGGAFKLAFVDNDVFREDLLGLSPRDGSNAPGSGTAAGVLELKGTGARVVSPVVNFGNYDGLSRDVVVVQLESGQSQAFYRSSGINSGMPGEWLPFDGVHMNGWLDKMRYTQSNGPHHRHSPSNRYGPYRNISKALGNANIAGGVRIETFQVNYVLDAYDALKPQGANPYQSSIEYATRLNKPMIPDGTRGVLRRAYIDTRMTPPRFRGRIR